MRDIMYIASARQGALEIVFSLISFSIDPQSIFFMYLEKEERERYFFLIKKKEFILESDLLMGNWIRPFGKVSLNWVHNQYKDDRSCRTEQSYKKNKWQDFPICYDLLLSFRVKLFIFDLLNFSDLCFHYLPFYLLLNIIIIINMYNI